MVSKVLYRPFEDQDFNDLAHILQDLWHTGHHSGMYNRLEACDDLAHCLSLATFSQVALIDNAPRGIILARSGEQNPLWRDHWEQVQDEFRRRMRAADSAAELDYRRFRSTTTDINSRMMRDSGTEDDNEIVLLAVDPTTHGQGVGTVLLDAATSYFADREQRRAFLFTDTDCTWEFYERRGLKRLAKHHATRDERKIIPKEMYLYGLDLSA